METYIIDGIRTPIGKFRGSLSELRADDLATVVIRELINRNFVDPELVDDVILGCANQAGEDNRNVARMAALLAGLPHSVPGETVNRLCSSGMSAVVHAHRAIKSGDGDLFIAGGVEHMTRGPWVMSKSAVPFGSDAKLYDSSFGWRFVNPKMKEIYGTEAMGETAENLVDKYSISREDQDQFALWSQSKASKARRNGRLSKEIVTLEVSSNGKKSVIFSADEFIREDTSLEALASLKPAFKKNGSVTAGNASGLNDGAASLLIASETSVKKLNLIPKARIVSTHVLGVEPRIMGIGPVEASNQALKKAGLTLADIDVIELNEAFAAQVLACTRSWGLDDQDSRLNPNGGAIALGHPLGMTGTRLLQTASIELTDKNKKYALCTLCVGVGQGYATILEKV